MSMTISSPTASGLMPTNMDQAVRLADMMAKGKLMPDHLRSQPGDCLMVIEQAMRWGMSPFAVAQSTSVIQGKLMFEGKLVAAALHASGALKSRLTYDYAGEGNARQITVSAVLHGEDAPRSVVVRLADARTANKMWTAQPDQQLAYHGARVWARRHCPEVMLGVYVPEEMEITPRTEAYAEGPTITATAEPVAEPSASQPPRRTVKMWLDDLEAEVGQSETFNDLRAIEQRNDVQKALNTLTNGALARLTEMLDAARDRFVDAPTDEGGAA
jgi:RecT family